MPRSKQAWRDWGMEADVRPFGDLFAEPPRNGLTRPKAVRGVGVKMVNMGELFAHSRLHNAPMDRVPLSEREATRFLVQPGDLLFARQSLVLEGAGKCSIFIGDDEPVTFESHVTRVRLDSRRADPRFYYYYLLSPHGRAAIRSIVEQGAGASGIRGSDLTKLSVEWRPVSEQRTVASMLDLLDDKIELNSRVSETLEAMAWALFKSWFVDFDPVSDAGELPEGWTIQTIGDLASVVGGTTPKTDQAEYWVNGTHHWATPKDLASLRTPVLLDTARRITDAGLSRIGSGLLPRGTVLMSSRAPIGYLAVTEVPVAINQGFIAIIPKPGISNLFLLHWARHSQDVIVRHANGSTFLEISKANFRPLPVVTPPLPVLRAFDELAQPLHGRMVACERESLTLAAVRDTLLPKLISGELRAPEVERIAVEAGA